MTDPASKTLHIKFSEAEIRRHAEQPHIRQLRDPRYPPLLLRFATGRARASWLIVRHAQGRSTSTKLGNWPDLPARAAIELLPQKLAELTGDPSAVVRVLGWETVADLLRWYDERAARDRLLSSKRRGTVRSLVACQLLPRVGSLRLLSVDRDALDERLVWPMQEARSLAYTRQAFGLLKVAFKQAARLKKLTINPLSDVVFTDFIQTKIRPKPARLRPQQLPELLEHLAERWETRPADAMLALMMLCHGTRIGETRLAKWSHIAVEEEWFIPADDTKTGAEHRLPITRHVTALLDAYRNRQLALGYDGIYLFPRGDGRPWTDRQASAVFDRLGAGEWTSHDLRKIARSMWADLGVDYLIGELLLNHALDDLDAAYIHTHAMTLKRSALERWHLWLAARGFPFFAAGTGPGRAEQQAPVKASSHAGWLTV
ncbi:tyrosine-type recombinase/integrase [Azotobacter beijerinckii]|uniref:Integrase n=1 Tax=Azotobacter beijerinckii TaxID=170623 RepID=A0A1I1B8E0_9GAMM|nr:site-specific integrase [Azotobacter beijerinckii]SFB46337.1 Integrase [Azotobacter beijerinckii]